MKWDEAAVEAAIRALPMRTDGKAPDVGEVVEMLRIGLWLGQANSLPRARPATQAQTMAELRKLCDLCNELANHIGGMRSPALRLVERHLKEANAGKQAHERKVYAPRLLTDQLVGTFIAARAGWIDAKAGDLPQPENIGTKPAAKMITDVCASVFQSVTGEPPGRSYDTYASKEGGAFVQFLGAVFEALGVKAKPAGQAKLLMEKRGAKTV